MVNYTVTGYLMHQKV